MNEETGDESSSIMTPEGKIRVAIHRDWWHPAGIIYAWVVVSGSSWLLEWFAGQPVPTIALYGRSQGLPLARTGPDKVPPFIAATRQLIALGHRRVVLITARARRTPVPGNVEQAFLVELATHGIATSNYNLPDWEETPQGLHALLENRHFKNQKSGIGNHQSKSATLARPKTPSRQGIVEPCC